MNKNKPSPSGLGIYAKNEKLKKIKKGADGQKWIVYKDCNGIKKWKLYKKGGGGEKRGRKNNNKEYDPKIRKRKNVSNISGRFKNENKNQFNTLSNEPHYNIKNVVKLRDRNIPNLKRQYSIRNGLNINKIEKHKEEILHYVRGIFYQFYDKQYFKLEAEIRTDKYQETYLMLSLFELIRIPTGRTIEEEIIHLSIHEVKSGEGSKGGAGSLHFKIKKYYLYKETNDIYLGIIFNDKINKFFIRYDFNLREKIINDYYYDLIKKFMDVVIESLNYNLELIVKSVYLK